jgi:hypothetical protein
MGLRVGHARPRLCPLSRPEVAGADGLIGACDREARPARNGILMTF